MTNSAVQAYRRDGYYVLEKALAIENIAALHREMAQVLASQLQYLGQVVEPGHDHHAVFRLMKQLFACDRKRYLASLRLISKLHTLQALMADPAIVEFARALGLELPVMQARPVFHVMSNELRFQDGYFGFGVHQDWPALQGSLDMVTAWVPFVDVDEDLFTLEVIPGSHLQGLLPGKITEHILEVDAAYYTDEAFVPVRARQGDVVFMSAFALHRSGTKGRDDAVRLAASCRYENALEECFVAHGFPFCQHTVVRRELIFADFPSQAQVAGACLKAQSR